MNGNSSFSPFSLTICPCLDFICINTSSECYNREKIRESGDALKELETRHNKSMKTHEVLAACSNVSKLLSSIILIAFDLRY